MNKNKKTDKVGLIKAHPFYKKTLDLMESRVRLAIEINTARKLRGFSQQGLAKEVGTTQKVISNIESGDTNVGFDLLTRVTKTLGIKFQVGRSMLVQGAGSLSDLHTIFSSTSTSIAKAPFSGSFLESNSSASLKEIQSSN